MTSLRFRVLGAAALAGLVITGQAAASDRYELRAGVLAHDTGWLEEAGPREGMIAFNAELRFPSPGLLDSLGSPQPHIGVNLVNESDGISFGYAGLGWDYDLFGPIFLTGSLGGTVHNAELLTEDDITPGAADQNPRLLGCRALFHLAIGVGVRVSERVNVHFYGNHISNANLCKSNEGLDDAGLRVGYRF